MLTAKELNIYTDPLVILYFLIKYILELLQIYFLLYEYEHVNVNLLSYLYIANFGVFKRGNLCWIYASAASLWCTERILERTINL